MSFWYSNPVTTEGGGGVTPPTPPPSATNVDVVLHDDLTGQITGNSDTFTVTRGEYESGSLDITIGGIGGMRLGIHYFEISPSSGVFRTARPLTSEDGPLIAQYTVSVETPSTSGVMLHDDLTGQITGNSDIFTVTHGSYTAGSLDISVGGLGGMREGIHYFEINPTAGTFRMARVLTMDDAPLVVQYTY